MKPITFLDKKKKIVKLNLEKVVENIERLEGFPNSRRFFEEAYTPLRNLIHNHGYNLKEKKGKYFILVDERTDSRVETIYEKMLLSDHLEFFMNHEGIMKNLMFSRIRGNIFDTKYDSPNKEDPKFFENLKSRIFGELRPVEIAMYDEKNIPTKIYNYLEESYMSLE